MTEPSKATIENYYDGRVEVKLFDFIHPLPRIEAAIETLAEWGACRSTAHSGNWLRNWSYILANGAGLAAGRSDSV